MDTQNVRNLEALKPKGSKAKIKLFGEYGDGRPIQDPYYGGRDGFEKTYQQVMSYSEGLLDYLDLSKVTPL